MTSRSSSPKARPRSKVLNRQRRFPLSARRLAGFADAVLNYLRRPDQEVVIMFVRDRKIQGYNARFLGHPWATDVISFPYARTRAAERGRRAHGPHLGDILISVDTAAANARRYRLPLARELKNLIIHGVVHLLGYDHTTDQGQMRALERRVRRALL